jgi:hypothetical protein
MKCNTILQYKLNVSSFIYAMYVFKSLVQKKIEKQVYENRKKDECSQSKKDKCSQLKKINVYNLKKETSTTSR